MLLDRIKQSVFNSTKTGQFTQVCSAFLFLHINQITLSLYHLPLVQHLVDLFNQLFFISKVSCCGSFPILASYTTYTLIPSWPLIGSKAKLKSVAMIPFPALCILYTLSLRYSVRVLCYPFQFDNWIFDLEQFFL